MEDHDIFSHEELEGLAFEFQLEMQIARESFQCDFQSLHKLGRTIPDQSN